MTSTVSALIQRPGANQIDLIEELAAASSVTSILLTNGAEIESRLNANARFKVRSLDLNAPAADLANIPGEVATDYLLIVKPGEQVALGSRAVERLTSTAEDSGAGLVYSDFRDKINDELQDHPLIDYRAGSIRDTFDFGSVFLLSKRAIDAALRTHGPIDRSLRFAALYDLRLKMSIDSPILRIPEPLYTRIPLDTRKSGDRQFDYVDPRKRDYQIEMEQVATAHLRRIGACVNGALNPRVPTEDRFPVKASVVIPVRNRERTIRDAALSALTQKTSFPFNVIVVDNHSTDGTSDILRGIAEEHAGLVHLVPSRRDYGIGGCWNEAVYSEHCGEFAVQLDSDDLYKDEHTLDKIVAIFEQAPYAMVIGAYTIVNFDLQEIPPGLIDHREWTSENGANNALRINGLGAPRALHVPTLRQFGFPNTSYGEDYAVALRICREYEIGRLYESVYFARRWEGNSDAALPLATSNRYDAYKDHLRTVEINARRSMNLR
ncbi:MAG TPA: glycosyltransferase family A protein [Blastocatellia bacterium]|nr:glycosyltransferase family A protein [Blastocatellia bacterium]